MVGDIFILVHSTYAFKCNITTSGFDWNIWLGLTSLEQLRALEWLQMAKQLQMSKQPQNHVFHCLVLIIIYYSYLIF
jgi:hypothetical protein